MCPSVAWNDALGMSLPEKPLAGIMGPMSGAAAPFSLLEAGSVRQGRLEGEQHLRVWVESEVAETRVG